MRATESRTCREQRDRLVLGAVRQTGWGGVPDVKAYNCDFYGEEWKD